MMSSPNKVEPKARNLTPAGRRAFRSSLIGTLIEWYDYGLYGAAAGLIIGPMFFPDAVGPAGTMAAFATFAVGFVARPLGGFVISHIGDRYGRKPAMVLTIVLMGAATVALGLLPTAAAIGIWAPILLILFRCLQGFGAGAELAGAFTLVAEFTPPKRRGFYTGLLNATVPAGSLIATIAFLGVSSLPNDIFLGWAWRVPFLASAALFFLALYMRHHMDESPGFAQATQDGNASVTRPKAPIGELFRHSRRQLLAGFLAVSGLNATGYIITAFSLAYLTSNAGMARNDALLAVIVSSIASMIGAPIGGMATDRFGARRVLAFGGIFGALFAYPLFALMQTGSLPLALIGMCVTGIVTMGATTGSNGAFLTNLFPVQYRFSGVATARELNGALIAGTTPLIATALIAAAGGAIWSAALFVSLCCVATALSVVVAKGQGNRQPEDETKSELGDPLAVR